MSLNTTPNQQSAPLTIAKSAEVFTGQNPIPDAQTEGAPLLIMCPDVRGLAAESQARFGLVDTLKIYGGELGIAVVAAAALCAAGLRHRVDAYLGQRPDNWWVHWSHAVRAALISNAAWHGEALQAVNHSSTVVEGLRAGGNEKAHALGVDCGFIAHLGQIICTAALDPTVAQQARAEYQRLDPQGDSMLEQVRTGAHHLYNSMCGEAPAEFVPTRSLVEECSPTSSDGTPVLALMDGALNKQIFGDAPVVINYSPKRYEPKQPAFVIDAVRIAQRLKLALDASRSMVDIDESEIDASHILAAIVLFTMATNHVLRLTKGMRLPTRSHGDPTQAVELSNSPLPPTDHFLLFGMKILKPPHWASHQGAITPGADS